MLGHAAANMVPVVASNRVGVEAFEQSEITFYGGSFIAGPTGGVVAQVGAAEEALVDGNPDPRPNVETEGVVMAAFDFEENRAKRAA